MGEGQQRLVENSRYFDDGNYHVVRFFRNNNDGLLRVDTLPKREVKPTGESTGVYPICLARWKLEGGAGRGGSGGVGWVPYLPDQGTVCAHPNPAVNRIKDNTASS